MLLYTRVAPAKVPKRRSRAGCTYCKEKKKKCTEERPQCSRCAEHGVQCCYEPVRPRRRRNRETTASSTNRGSSSRMSSARSFYLSGYSLFEGSGDDSDGNNHDPHYQTWSQTAGSPNESWCPVSQLWTDCDVGWSDSGVLSPLDMSSPFSLGTGSLLGSFSASGDGVVDMNTLSPMSPLTFNFPPNYEDNQGDETLESSSQAGMAAVPISGEGAGALVPYDSLALSTAAQQQPLSASPASDSLYPEMHLVSPLLEFRAPAFAEFSARPHRRALVDHFCNVLSHLIVFREESGNPFQQLVLPLTARSGTVAEAMYALASAHLEYRGVETGERSVSFHNRAIQGLAGLIRKQAHGVDRNELLAAIMLLVYYEVLVQKGRSNIVEGHLRGALAIICTNEEEPLDPTATFLERAFRFYDVIAALSHGTAPLSPAPAAGCLAPLSPPGAAASSPLSSVDTLLGMATTLWPVMHRLSTLPSLRAELDAAVVAAPSSAKVAVLRTEFDMSADATESALLRWRPRLPRGVGGGDGALGRLGDDDDDDDEGGADAVVVSGLGLEEEQQQEDGDGDLARGVEDISSPPPPLDLREGSSPPSGATAAAEEESQPVAGSSSNPATGDSDRLRSIAHTALAYKHGALVYLYRTVHGLGRTHGAVQRHARAALRHCAGTVAARGPMGALLWPLFVAACEAVGAADRARARDTFRGVARRQGMMNIERAWEIVQEVWRRADEDEAGGAAAAAAGPGHRGPLLFGEVYGVGSEPAGGGRPLSCAGSGGDAAAPLRKRGTGADLWRRVSEDMGVNIVFG